MKKLINAILASTVFSGAVSVSVAMADDTLICNPRICATLDANAMKPNGNAQKRNFMYQTYNYAIADKLSTSFHQNKSRLSQDLNDRQDAELVKFVETISTQQALNTIYYFSHVPGADVIQLSYRFKNAAEQLTRKSKSSAEERKSLWIKVMKDFEADQDKWLAGNPGSSFGTLFLYSHAMNGMYAAFTNDDGQLQLSLKEAAVYMKSISATLILLKDAEKSAAESNR